MANAVKKKIWKFPEILQASEGLLKLVEGSEVLAQLMLQRGITEETAGAFLDPSKYTPTSPMAFADMGKAIVRITQAISTKEKITVYGDYDVDGVTATSVMLTALRKLGANVDFYIPNRANEGYGLNLKAVSILASKHRTKLIITCDCGISNFAEINLAKSLGVETIIADHHSMPDLLPPAVAILHPKQFEEDHPLFHLPGVGVAYKLAEALFVDNQMEEEIPKLLDFLTMGMIADMVPLIKENRYLVQIGLPALVKSERAGIQALLENTVKTDGTDIVGFGLAPRINAVGRLADAGLAVELMTVEDEQKAQELAQQLEHENARRQELCEQIFFEADQKAKQALANGKDAALALYSEGWHHGVVGIVASRLVEKYHCPVFVAELEKEEGKLKGSARGVPGIDLYQILKANEHLMTKWGGHQMAAGFSAEATNADALCRALVDTCTRALNGQSKRPVLDIDLHVETEDVDLSLAKTLRKLGPFGMWNKKPVLAMQSLTVLNTRPLGKEGKHHRLVLRSADHATQFECVYWRSGEIPADGEEIDLAFNPDVNVFNKTERLQLVLCDWRRSGELVEEEEPEILDFTPPLVAEAANSTPAAASKTNALSSPSTTSNASTASQEASTREIAASAQENSQGGTATLPDFISRKSGSTFELPVVAASPAEKTKSPGSGNSVSQSEIEDELDADGKTTERVIHLETNYDGDTASTVVVDQLVSTDTQLNDGSSIDMRPERTRITAESVNELESILDDSLTYDDDFSAGIMSGGISEQELYPKSYLKQKAAKSEPLVDTGVVRDSFPVITPQPVNIQVSWKDLRQHTSPATVAETAARKLGSQVQIYAEACKLEGHSLVDRTMLSSAPHLVVWQYPPTLQAFRNIIGKSQASNIYLCGAGAAEQYNASSFLKRLLAMVRFAVNQRDGQAQSDKLCAGLATSKMSLALGLTLLKKADVIDWYAEDSVIFLDISGAPGGGWENLLEYRQLANTLQEITEFRNWCAEAPLDEIQSELVPNAIRISTESAGANQEGPQHDIYPKANYNDRSPTSGQFRKG